MPGFVKIYGDRLLRSTLWVGSDPTTKVLWITMLAMADQKGEVHASLPGLAHMAGITLDECAAGLDYLLAPDPHSQTKDFEGRRIEAFDGMWVILNYLKYREYQTEAQMKDAARKKAYREKQAGHVPDVQGSPRESTPKADADASSNANAKTEAAAACGHVHNVRDNPGHVPGQTNVPTSPDEDMPSDVYYRHCTITLNEAMAENPTLEGGWIPVTASSQIGRVTWLEDGIPLEVAGQVIRERTEAYQSRPQARGPMSLKYFDAAVREQWERGRMTAAEDRVHKAFET